MPQPIESGRRYVPGLDGIRALAVACVILYHLGVPGAQGGMLGVGVFFTLSGYLITDLLLTSWDRKGSLGLGQFWIRRARRLLPALFLMLVVVSVWVALFDSGQLGGVRTQVLAAGVYVSNWVTIAQHGSYFARFAAPLPLDHLWSLAIEEQFYLLWPWLVMLGVWAVRKRWLLALLTLALAVFSAVAMSRLYHPGYDPTRAYEGTDTRAFGLLIGAALAMAWPSRGSRPVSRDAVGALLDVLGVAGLVAIVVLVWRTSPFSAFLYPWGFVLLSLATAAVIAAVVNPASRLGAALGCAPLRWVGVRSYGIYLWQWPIIVLLAPTPGAPSWPPALVLVALTLVIASLSWRLVEEPIRRGALARRRRQLRFGAARRRRPRGALAASSVLLAVLCVPVISLSGLLPAASAGHDQRVALLAHTRPITGGDPAGAAAAAARTAAAALTLGAVPNKTSCRSVVYIGDSTSEGETSTSYIPNPRQRLPAQLRRVGVRHPLPEISGARSIVEVYKNFPNAATVARGLVAHGFRGCWILALGTNDAADVAIGSYVGLVGRIERMMSVIGSQPVLWVDAVTLDSSGPYVESGMQRWNRDLLAACGRYPNMRVFDWAAYAKPRWFIPDGIHYYSPGYVARAHLIAHGLAHAFPAGQPPNPACVVR
jgi:peptidoglycan/LPS O-acetylase OafA/YrhL